MVPRHVTRVLVEAERPAVEAWASRNAWEVQFLPDLLVLNATVKHPTDGQLLWLTADLSGYRALPPAWRFVNAEGQETRNAYPSPGSLPGGKSSIFHSKPVICAPFNRLSYKDAEGPHANDWGDSVRWTRIQGDFATPKTLADMLMVIATHLTFSTGRQ